MAQFPWLDLMHQEIGWEQRIGWDEYGDATYAASQTLRCRIVYKQRPVRGVGGQEVVSNATIYVAGDYGITDEDRVTLPNGDTPKILRVNSYPDEDGTHHQEVLT